MIASAASLKMVAFSVLFLLLILKNIGLLNVCQDTKRKKCHWVHVFKTFGHFSTQILIMFFGVAGAEKISYA
jgi:hypothetical protein